MFANVTAYDGTSSSESRIIQPALIREVKPHADVTVDGTPTGCVEVVFDAAHSVIVLIDMSSMQSHLQALTGLFDDYGSLL
jgi:hypothetical protein